MGIFKPSVNQIEKWKEQKNVKKLLGGLSIQDYAIQQAAAEALSKIGGQEVLDYCKEKAKDFDPKIRWLISLILGGIGTPQAMKILGTVEDPTETLSQRIKTDRKK